MSSQYRIQVGAIVGDLTLGELRCDICRLSQRELASRMGMPQSHVSRIERAKSMKISTLESYINALGGELHLRLTWPEL